MEMIQLATKKQVPVNLNGKEVIFELQLENIQYLQEKTKKPLETILVQMQQGDLNAVLMLIYSMAKDKKTGKILGEKFFKSFDQLSIITHLTPIIQELVTTELPEADGETEGK